MIALAGGALTVAPAAAQRGEPIVTDEFDSTDGLTGRSVTAITALPTLLGGGLLVGTRTGAFVLEGTRLRQLGGGDTCDPEGDSAFADGMITGTGVDADGAAWVAGERRLARLGSGSECWATILPADASLISSAAVVDGRFVVFAENGPQRADAAGVAPLPLDTTDPPFGAATIDGGGTVTWGPTWLRVGDRVFDDLSPEVLDVATVDDTVYAATRSGLFAVSDTVRSLADGTFVALERSTDGLLAASESAVWRVSDDALTELVTVPAGRAVTTLHTDDDGNLWVGTTDGVVRIGLQRWRRETTLGVVADADIGRDPVVAVIPGVAASGTSTIWVPDQDGWRVAAELGDGAAHDIAATGTSLIVATTEGVYAVDRDDGSMTSLTDLADTIARGVVVDQRGRAWVATNHGVYVTDVELDTATPVAIAALDTDDYQSVWLDPSGDVWAGTATLGAVLIDADDLGVVEVVDDAGHLSVLAGTVVDDQIVLGRPRALTAGPTALATPSAARVNAVVGHAERSDLVWAATDDGLFLQSLDPAVTGSRFAAADGLPSSRVNDVATGSDGWLWIATDGGLVRHRDAGLAPALTSWRVVPSTGPCDGCAELPYQTDSVELALVVTDLGDLRDLRVEIAVDDGSEVPVTIDGTTFDVDEGGTYTATVTVTDRHFNERRVVLDEPIRVGRPGVVDQLREASGRLLTYVAIAVIIAAGYAVFLAWRRWGRRRLIDVELTVDLVDGRPHTSLASSGVLGARRRPAEFEAFARLDADAIAYSGTATEDEERFIGRSVWEQFCGDAVGRRLAKHCARRRRRPIRLRIIDTTSRLDWVPWELLADQGGSVVDRNLAIVRQVGDPVEPAAPHEVSVLAARAGYAGTADAELNPFARQLGAITDAFGDQVTTLDDIGLFEFAERLGGSRWDIVHVYSHGSYDDRHGGALRLVTQQDGRRYVERFRAKSMADRLKDPALLIVVAACATSAPLGGELPGLAESLVRTGRCRHAIAFAHDVSQQKLDAFSVEFYRVLAATLQVDVAAAAGRAAVGGGADAAAVRVYAAATDGLLYNKR